ncbi:MAG: hypothetical protein AB7Q00_09840 [Phycisphaerales bacterium]
MSQFGMQMPNARASRRSSLDVHVAMMALAVLFLLMACVVMWMAGSKVGVDGNWWSLQAKPADGGVKLPAAAK